MDRNQATGLFLISALLLVYLAFFAPKEPKQKPADPKARTSAPAARRSEVAPAPLAPADSASRAAQLGAFTVAAASDAGKTLTLENKNLLLEVNTRGGLIQTARLKNYRTWEQQPLDLLNPRIGNLDITLPLADGKSVRLSQLAFVPTESNLAVTLPSGLKARRWTLAATLGPNQVVEQSYTLPDEAFTVGYDLRLRGLDPVVAAGKSARLTWVLNPIKTERVLKQNRASVTINYRTHEGEFAHLTEGSSESPDSIQLDEKLTWFTHKTPFFSAGLIAQEHAFTGGEFKTRQLPSDSLILRHLRASVGLPVAALTSPAGGQYQFFFGPNDYKLLKKTAPDFDRNVYLGWGIFSWVNKGLIIPVFHFLEGFIRNYGIIIVLLVFFVKMLLFPLTYKSYVSMARMRVLKPEIDEIKARVGEENTQQVQMETMQLYQEMGVSPLSGCIPTLLTIPILLAMFQFFPNAIELRQEPFLWAKDLSSYDEFVRLPFTIPFYGNHVSLFTLLMTLSTLVLTWQNNQTSAMQGPMKFYSYLMPVIFMFVLNDFAAGLTWYYLVSNLVTIGQQAIISRMVDDSSLRAKLEANREKHRAAGPDAKKKPSFQARLAEAMKAAQEQAQKEKEARSGRK
ncbi:MAG TPA: membrane protein insertase YidC [bacterium]|nr:membrane protein insertase YidC [bacterium]